MSRYDLLTLVTPSCGVDWTFQARDPATGAPLGAAAAGFVYTLKLCKANSRTAARTLGMVTTPGQGFRHLSGNPGDILLHLDDLADVLGDDDTVTVYGDLLLTPHGEEAQLVQRLALAIERAAAAPAVLADPTNPTILLTMGL